MLARGEVLPRPLHRYGLTVNGDVGVPGARGGRVQGELAEEFAGGYVDHSDAAVLDE
jgi:hypothetical protein